MWRAVTVWFAIACCAASMLGATTSIARGRVDHEGRPLQMLQSPEPTASGTPLPPPIVPPPDAAGISPTTPPIGPVSPAPSPTLPNMLWLASSATSTVSFTMHGGRPYVPVVVDGVRHDWLLSDLQPSAVDESLPLEMSGNQTVVRTLQIGDLRLTNVPAVRRRLLPFTETYVGEPASGIIGEDVFSRFPVTIDYLQHTITIYQTEKAAIAARPTGASVTPLQVIDGAPSVACAINGKSATPCFVDVYSDADIALWQPGSKDVMNRHSMRMRDAEVDHEISGTVARAHSLMIGTMSVSGALVEVMDGTEDAYLPKPAIRSLLGSGVLSRFAVTIDEPGGTLSLATTPAMLASPSAFDASGLWLVWRNGDAVVRSVVPASPGDKAGLHGGDVIVAVNGSALLDLDAARQALMGPTGTIVHVTVLRGKKRKDVAIELRSLL